MPRDFRSFRDALFGTFWFIPASLVAGSAILAVLLVEASAHIDPEVLTRWPRLFGASASSSRGMLATIAGSMITAAGVTFSITMVAVTQAATQYSPRILRNFMRDRASQVVLGGLAGVFTYCLVVLRTIRGGEDIAFVPSLAVLVGFILAGVGIALLIYFIHHIADALQASTIVARVSRETRQAIERQFPDEIRTPPPRSPSSETRRWLDDQTWQPVFSRRTGYIRRVDLDELLRIARDLDVVVRVVHTVGDFIIHGSPLASFVPRRDRGIETAPVANDPAAAIRNAFHVGTERTIDQDVGFGLQQLTDIAVKALSSGINDPTTAMTCIDYVGATLAHAAARADVSVWRADGDVVRVIARGPTFADLVRLGYDEIRRHAAGKVSVLSRIAGALRTTGLATFDPERRRAVLDQLDLVYDAADWTVSSPADRGLLLETILTVRGVLVMTDENELRIRPS